MNFFPQIEIHNFVSFSVKKHNSKQIFNDPILYTYPQIYST